VVTTAGRLTSTISRPPLTSHVTVALKVKDTSELATQHRIALHDVVVAETKKTAALLTIGQFPVQGAAGFNEEFISRVGRYETAVADVMKLQALLGYWAGTANEAALTLAPKRLADEICPETGLVVWTQTLYARALGNARGGNPAAAEPDVQELAKVVAALKDNYWMTETEVQRLTTQGWVEFAKGNRGAADMEDANEQSSPHPGAHAARARALRRHAARRRPSRGGAGRVREIAAARAEPLSAPVRRGPGGGAGLYFSKLAEMAGPGVRAPELQAVRQYLAKN